MLQDNIERTLLATGAPVSACVISLNSGENLANQKSELRIKEVVNNLYK